MAKSATFSGSVTIAKALASLEKTNEKTVRQASDFCTSVEKVKKLIEIKGWSERHAAGHLGVSLSHVQYLLSLVV